MIVIDGTILPGYVTYSVFLLMMYPMRKESGRDYESLISRRASRLNDPDKSTRGKQ